MTKVSETAHENSRPEQGRIASRLRGCSFGFSPTQSGSFACTAVVFTQSALVCVQQLPGKRRRRKLRLARASDGPLFHRAPCRTPERRPSLLRVADDPPEGAPFRLPDIAGASGAGIGILKSA